jgi:hypothetical protein
VTATRAFNDAVVDNLTYNRGLDLTFKAESHMTHYNKHLVHTMSQTQAASVQAAVDAAADPQHMPDLEAVLRTILTL